MLGLTVRRQEARAVRRCGELAKRIEAAKNQHDARTRAATHPSSRKAAANGASQSRISGRAARVRGGLTARTAYVGTDPPFHPIILGAVGY